MSLIGSIGSSHIKYGDGGATVARGGSDGDRNSDGNGGGEAKDDAFFKLPAKFAIVQICSVCQWL